MTNSKQDKACWCKCHESDPICNEGKECCRAEMKKECCLDCLGVDMADMAICENTGCKCHGWNEETLNARMPGLLLSQRQIIIRLIEEARKEAIQTCIKAVESFEVPEGVEIQPQSQRKRTKWQNLVVKLIVKKLKRL